MKCPICNQNLQPGKVCSCGWDPSCDYESYLSLVPAPTGTRSAAAQREQRTQKLLDAQREAYEAKIEALNTRQDACEKQIKKLAELLQKESKENAAKFTALASLQKTNEAKINALTLQLKSLQAGINLKKGDVISFGQYWQGKSQSAGKSAIQWRVLAKEGSRALLISKYGLDCQKYRTINWYDLVDSYVTWEDCSLRSWLNHDFYDAAFSTEEKRSILTATVTADANPKYKTNPGSNTEDKVFLLSIPEAEKYFASDDDRRCAPTAYALAQGAYVDDDFKTAEGEACCWWCLRSLGSFQDLAAGVTYAGSVDNFGLDVSYDGVCVRPALWINL